MNVLTIGIIGAGRIGKLHVDNLQLMPQVKIKAVSDVVISHLEGIPFFSYSLLFYCPISK